MSHADENDIKPGEVKNTAKSRLWLLAAASVPSAFAICAILAVGGCGFIRSDNMNQAIRRGDIGAVRKALDTGVRVNGRGMHALMPLMVAAEFGRLDICRMLVERGADVNGHNDSSSVLMAAAGSQNEELVRFLLKAGAGRSWSNSIGQTAESQSRQRGSTNIAELVKIR